MARYVQRLSEQDQIDQSRCTRQKLCSTPTAVSFLVSRGDYKPLLVAEESRGFGFVKMDTPEDAEAVIQALNGTNLEGKTLTVAHARRGRARTPTPGQYQGVKLDRFGGGGGGGYGGGRGYGGGGGYGTTHPYGNLSTGSH